MSDLTDKLSELNPEAVLFEPREFYDLAIINITDVPEDRWMREIPGIWVAVYDYNSLVDAALRCNGIEPENATEQEVDEAQEWTDYNTCSMWAGPNTPMIHEEKFEDFDLW